jgi:hypothetical protein
MIHRISDEEPLPLCALRISVSRIVLANEDLGDAALARADKAETTLQKISAERAKKRRRPNPMMLLVLAPRRRHHRRARKWRRRVIDPALRELLKACRGGAKWAGRLLPLRGHARERRGVEMRLSELHPEYGTTDDYRGQWFLSFDCPTTPKGRVYVLFHRQSPEPGIWQCVSLFKIIPGLEHLGEMPDLACLTLDPSIGTHYCTKRVCHGHVRIINGEVLP